MHFIIPGNMALICGAEWVSAPPRSLIDAADSDSRSDLPGGVAAVLQCNIGGQSRS